MPNDRCFRIDQLDVDELRDQARNQALIDSFTHWVQAFAPNVDVVVAKIECAFANTKLDNGIGLFEASGLNDYAADAELRQLRESDEKVDWKRISVVDLAKCYCSPTFFDPQGFVFHLPTFLIAELNDKHPYGFIDRLYAADEHPKGWRALLTSEQRDAIIATLELIREHPNYQHEMDDIDASIDWYRNAGQMG